MFKRVVVIDIGEGVIEFVNFEIEYSEGSVVDVEGCFFVLNVWGEVERL